MKVRLMAEITDDNGKKVIKPVEIETEVPDIEEFGDKGQFYEVFDRYEKPVLAARTRLMEELTSRRSTVPGIFLHRNRGWNAAGIPQSFGLPAFQQTVGTENTCLFHGWCQRYSPQYRRNVCFSALSDHFGLVSPKKRCQEY